MTNYSEIEIMKKACIVALSVIMLTGCGSEGAFSYDEEPSENRFKVLDGEISDNFYVAYDTVTGIEYSVSNGLYNHGTLTVLVDAGGKPLIYEGWKNEMEYDNR